jgi:heme/copper-type cytochrome/quinol oxidase subunit 4
MTAAEPVVPRATTRDDTRQHSLPATVGYHLVPGLLILAVTLAALPLVTAAGLPPIAAVLVGILVGQLPVQLVYLLLVGRRRNGRLSLAGVVLYRERLSRWLYPLLIVGILAWSWVFYFLLRPVSSALQSTLFAWVPAGFAATGHADAASLADYPKSGRAADVRRVIDRQRPGRPNRGRALLPRIPAATDLSVRPEGAISGNCLLHPLSPLAAMAVADRPGGLRAIGRLRPPHPQHLCRNVGTLSPQPQRRLGHCRAGP